MKTTGLTQENRHGARLVNPAVDPPYHTRADETVITFLPFFHIFGLATLHYLLYHGTRAVCMPRFDLRLYLEVKVC